MMPRASLLLLSFIASISALGEGPPLESNGNFQSESAEVFDPSLINRESWASNDHKFLHRRIRGNGVTLQSCAALTAPSFEVLKGCNLKHFRIKTADPSEVIEITNIGDNEFKSAFPQFKLQLTTSFLIRNTQISELHVVLKDAQRNVTLKITNNIHLKNLIFEIDLMSESKVFIEISGNPSLSQDTLEGIKKTLAHLDNGIEIVRFQEGRECFFDRPLKTFSELKDCGYYFGDITIDSNTNISESFPETFKNVTGCLIIQETKLVDINFVHQLTVACDNDRKNSIRWNSQLCLKQEEQSNIIAHLGPTLFSGNMKYCDAICSPTYIKKAKDKTCTIIEGELQIENWDENLDELSFLSNIEEIRGSLVFVRGTMETLDLTKIFPRLRIINATQYGTNALDIVANKNLKKIVFHNSKRFYCLWNLHVQETKKKISIGDNGEYKIEDDLRDFLAREYGWQYVLIVGEGSTSVQNSEFNEHENGNAHKDRKEKAKNDNVEDNSTTVGIILGVLGGILFVLIVAGGVAVIVLWKIKTKAEKQKQDQEEEELEELEKEKKEKEKEEKEKKLAMEKEMQESRYFRSTRVSMLPTLFPKPFVFATESQLKEGRDRLERNKQMMKRDRVAKKEAAMKKDTDDKSEQIFQNIEDESEIKSETMAAEEEAKPPVIQDKEEGKDADTLVKDTEGHENKKVKRNPAGGDKKKKKKKKDNDMQIENTQEHTENVKNEKNECEETIQEKIEKLEKKIQEMEKLEEDPVPTIPLRKFTGQKEFISMVTEHKMELVRLKMQFEVEKNLPGIKEEQKAVLKKLRLKADPSDLVIDPPPITVVDGLRRRVKRAVIDHLNKDASNGFVSRLDKDNKKELGSLDEINVPVVYEQSFKYTLQRMQLRPKEFFEEQLVYEQLYKKDAKSFDICRPYNLRREQSRSNRPSIENPYLELHKFKHQKNDKRTNVTEIVVVPTDHDEFLENIIMAYMSIEMDRWLDLEADQFLALCKMALEKVKNDAQALVSITDFKGRIIGEIRGKFDDLRKALSVGTPIYRIDTVDCGNYVFLGNYLGYEVTNVDTIGLLFALTAKTNCILLRGLTEWREIQEKLEFKKELEHRFGRNGDKIFDAINEVFDYLPFACKVGENIMCSHAGVAPNMKDLTKLKLPVKELEPKTLPYNLMFALPNYTVNEFTENCDYGVGYYFGEKQLIDAGDHFKFETMFVSKALNTGWGQFGEGPVMLALGSGMNLEGKSDKLISAVVDICVLSGKDVVIRVIYQNEPDEKAVLVYPKPPAAKNLNTKESEKNSKNPSEIAAKSGSIVSKNKTTNSFDTSAQLNGSELVEKETLKKSAVVNVKNTGTTNSSAAEATHQDSKQ